MKPKTVIEYLAVTSLIGFFFSGIWLLCWFLNQ